MKTVLTIPWLITRDSMSFTRALSKVTRGKCVQCGAARSKSVSSEFIIPLCLLLQDYGEIIAKGSASSGREERRWLRCNTFGIVEWLQSCN